MERGAGLSKREYEQLAEYRALLRRTLRRSEEAARDAGITPQQAQLLVAIKGRPGRDWASITELAEALQVRHHAAVGLVDRSSEAGLVVRSSAAGDMRVVAVRLTVRGEDALREVQTAIRAELEEFRAVLD